MPIPLERARTALAEFQAGRLANLYAQAHAKHVLHEVRERPANFPSFDPQLDDKVTVAAYGVLAIGCSLAEHRDRAGAASALEQAASLLHYAHGPFGATSRESGFHMLVAAMAFYAAGQYSRAFVAVRAVEEQTPAARVIAAFLRKDVADLIARLNDVLLRETPAFEEQLELDQWAITIAIARSIAVAHEFTITGSAATLSSADDHLHDAASIAAADGHSAWWWIVRLLRLMLKDLGEASPWHVLPPHFDPGGKPTLERYIRLLAFMKPPVTELWVSQRSALPLALDAANSGAVINLRTSAGKTRVAELAILQALLADASARVIYLAPFRSLALEVEHTLSASFSWLGFGVSHLYGGARVSSVDTELAADSNITIATPEKVRALLRAAPELFERVKLVIVDEGHLIGAEERYVRNEVFVDHLLSLTRATGARVLLLSAVLPNPQELAEWVTGDPAAVASSNWKPSAERFGLLRWNGARVRLDWLGDVTSFNPSFVEAKPLGFGRRRKPYPNDKREAVAATAVRLSAVGPVMIFTGKAGSVPTLADAVLLALGAAPEPHPWPAHEWRVFEAVCQEELEPDSVELRAARAGVICHSNRLPAQVRLAIEYLMRSKPPKIIVATTTLAQGVNVGISSVIVASPYISQKTIGKREFWNICGRAGRAFVDGEGKILYAIDDTKEGWQVSKDEELARGYFAGAATDRVESGLLFVVRALRRLAGEANVAFDLLLQLVAENDFSPLGDKASACAAACDLFDDELLALHSDPVLNPDGADPSVWVDRLLRRSLAVIQARLEPSEAAVDDVLGFLRARADSAMRRVAQPVRRAVVTSGLPLTVAIRAHADREVFVAIAGAYSAAGESVEALAAAIRAFEEWARGNAAAVTEQMAAAAALDAIRAGWLTGVGLRSLRSLSADAERITKELYGYQLPWVIHAASQLIRTDDEDEAGPADALARIALLLELGVPNELAARIFLAGVRSRTAASELSGLGVEFALTVSGVGRQLRNAEFTGAFRARLAPATANWLDLMADEEARRRQAPIPAFARFTVPGFDGTDVLHARRLGETVFLTASDGHERFAVGSSPTMPFDRVANDPRVAFVRSGRAWELVVRDPRVEPAQEE